MVFPLGMAEEVQCCCPSTPNGGIIESFQLEGVLKDHLVQLLYNEQGHLQLDQVFWSLVQPYFILLSNLNPTSLSLKSFPFSYHNRPC